MHSRLARCFATATSTHALSGRLANSSYTFAIPGLAPSITVPQTGTFLDLQAAIANHSPDTVSFATLRGDKIAGGTPLRGLEAEPFLLRLAQRNFKLTLHERKAPRAEDYYFDYAVSIGLPASEATLLAEFVEKLDEKLKVLRHSDADKARVSREELVTGIQKAMQYFAEYQLSSDTDPRFNSHAYLSKLLLDKQDLLAEMQKQKAALDVKAEKRANALMYCGLSVLVAEFAFITMGTFYFFCWDIMEPVAYLMGTGNTLAAFALFILRNLELSAGSLQEALKSRFARRLYRRKKFDMEQFEALEQEISSLRGALEEL